MDLSQNAILIQNIAADIVKNGQNDLSQMINKYNQIIGLAQKDLNNLITIYRDFDSLSEYQEVCEAKSILAKYENSKQSKITNSNSDSKDKLFKHACFIAQNFRIDIPDINFEKDMDDFMRRMNYIYCTNILKNNCNYYKITNLPNEISENSSLSELLNYIEKVHHALSIATSLRIDCQCENKNCMLVVSFELYYAHKTL